MKTMNFGCVFPGLFAVVAMAQAPSISPAAHPENRNALEEIQGRVEAIDIGARRLQIRNTQDQPVVLRIDPATRILNNKNHEMTLSGVERNDRVVAYFNRTDGAARQVDVSPTFFDAVLGE